ncbi:hypothetical protein EON83_17520 [bacterium]|nr:MAG: hypothetical protein EON83_17520 [bacterium]
MAEVRQIERDSLIAQLQDKFHDRTDVEAVWANLLADLEKGKPVYTYNGQQVLLKGFAILKGNPIRVQIANSADASALVFLQEKDVNKLAAYGEEARSIEVRGVARSIDPNKKQVEVWSMETTVSGAD